MVKIQIIWLSQTDKTKWSNDPIYLRSNVIWNLNLYWTLLTFTIIKDTKVLLDFAQFVCLNFHTKMKKKNILLLFIKETH